MQQYTYKNVWLEIRLKYSTFWFQSSIWKDYFSKIGKTLFKDKYWTKLNWFDSSSSTFWSVKKWQLFATSHERWDSSGKKKLQYFWMCENILHHTPYLITLIELSTILILMFTFQNHFVFLRLWSINELHVIANMWSIPQLWYFKNGMDCVMAWTNNMLFLYVGRPSPPLPPAPPTLIWIKKFKKISNFWKMDNFEHFFLFLIGFVHTNNFSQVLLSWLFK